MGTLSPVGIHNDFAPGQPRVSMGAPNHKFARGVDVQLMVAFEQGLDPLAHRCLHARNEHVGHVFFDLCQHGLVVWPKVVVLRAEHDGLDAHGGAIVVVLNGDLALRIGTQIGHDLALFPNVRQLTEQTMRQFQSQWHVVVRLAARVAKHHALVACPLILRIGALHALVDV